ncbi:hypothetical protein HNQ59_000186 [Chitinivorax tropicus]|uniref:Uncharacterized protein n=1 Tax=Chitinivorax tropicus TaxID=714531 RepID=A0A840MC77_9PROT|nr:hypothetical protein [Chitinivorax tropicus]MBB5016924.1 hypothetical protein [Chitinivorax tropicus]
MAYTTIKGWLSVPANRLAEATAILDDHQAMADRAGIGRDLAASYRSGWLLQTHPINGACLAFYGAEIKTTALPLIEAQVSALAQLEFQETEAGVLVETDGYFHLDQDTQGERARLAWLVRDGEVLKMTRPFE